MKGGSGCLLASNEELRANRHKNRGNTTKPIILEVCDDKFFKSLCDKYEDICKQETIERRNAQHEAGKKAAERIRREIEEQRERENKKEEERRKLEEAEEEEKIKEMKKKQRRRAMKEKTEAQQARHGNNATNIMSVDLCDDSDDDNGISNGDENKENIDINGTAKGVKRIKLDINTTVVKRETGTENEIIEDDENLEIVSSIDSEMPSQQDHQDHNISENNELYNDLDEQKAVQAEENEMNLMNSTNNNKKPQKPRQKRNVRKENYVEPTEENFIHDDEVENEIHNEMRRTGFGFLLFILNVLAFFGRNRDVLFYF